jgi:hypothetical protein
MLIVVMQCGDIYLKSLSSTSCSLVGFKFYSESSVVVSLPQTARMYTIVSLLMSWD